MKKVALFDVCHTLVNTSTIREFTEDYLQSPKHIVWKILRKLRLVDSEMYRAHYAKIFKGYEQARVERLGREYARYLMTVLKDATMERFQNLKNQGYEIYLVSAGFDVYLKYFAELLGVNLVCTVLEVDDQKRYTGAIAGGDCYDQGKVEKLQAALRGQSIDWAQSISFGDSKTDIAILSTTGTACVVDPESALVPIAKEKGWETILSPRKIKILFSTTSDLVAGAEKTLVDVLKSINRKVFIPQVVILRHDMNGDLAEIARELGVPVYILGIQHKWQFYKIWKMVSVIKRFKPDIIESFLFFDNQITRILGKIFQVPVIISGQQNAYLKRSTLRNIVDRATLFFADHVISNSQAGKDWYTDRKYCEPNKISVIRSGIDFEQIAYLQEKNSKSDPRNIFGVALDRADVASVSIGFLTEQKGIEYLIRAIALEKSGRLHHFIIGEGPLRETLESESRRLGVSDRIHFVGFRSLAAQYLHLFDVFILSSLWEGLPNVVIEAMASHIPIIATNVGGVAEIIVHTETGFLIPAGNENALDQVLGRYMELGEDQCSSITKKAYDYARNYLTVQKMVDDRERLYEKLLH
jgi:HAD superfamily hydrolase (TIGR01490 family)